jgi:hypothetical protein
MGTMQRCCTVRLCSRTSAASSAADACEVLACAPWARAPACRRGRGRGGQGSVRACAGVAAECVHADVAAGGWRGAALQQQGAGSALAPLRQRDSASVSLQSPRMPGVRLASLAVCSSAAAAPAAALPGPSPAGACWCCSRVSALACCCAEVEGSSGAGIASCSAARLAPLPPSSCTYECSVVEPTAAPSCGAAPAPGRQPRLAAAQHCMGWHVLHCGAAVTSQPSPQHSPLRHASAAQPSSPTCEAVRQGRAVYRSSQQRAALEGAARAVPQLCQAACRRAGQGHVETAGIRQQRARQGSASGAPAAREGRGRASGSMPSASSGTASMQHQARMALVAGWQGSPPDGHRAGLLWRLHCKAAARLVRVLVGQLLQQPLAEAAKAALHIHQQVEACGRGGGGGRGWRPGAATQQGVI